jgi:hypothetical protein
MLVGINVGFTVTSYNTLLEHCKVQWTITLFRRARKPPIGAVVATETARVEK